MNRLVRRVAQKLDALPSSMSQSDATFLIARALEDALDLQQFSVLIYWKRDVLDVTMPTRPYLIPIVDDVIALVQGVVERVGKLEVSQLTDEQLEDRMRALRGIDEDA